MSKKLKVYIALSVYLRYVEDKYSGNNGNKQFTILCRASSKKEVARILANSKDNCHINNTYAHLLKFNGIHEAPEKLGYTGQHIIKDIVLKDNTIYFNPQHTKSGFHDIWVEYSPEN